MNASISQVASQLGVSAHTLRYYERLGLLDTVRKRGGVRTYSPQDIEWLRFLRRLREVGMPMRKVAVYARLRKAGSATLIERRALLQEQLSHLEKQREVLSGHHAALLRKLAIYDSQIQQRSNHRMNRRNVIQTAGVALAGAPVVALSAEGTTVADSRRRRGLETLNRITQGQGRAVIESLADIAPALGDFIVEFSYGDVISRPQLDVKSRELATVAALAALGNAQPQLKVHIHGALNVGASREEIVEILIQTAVYAGFPAAINAVSTARQAFAERN